MRSTFFKPLFVGLICSIFLLGCSNSSSGSTSYDGREYDISVNQDKSLICKSVKNNNYYDLTISGIGKAVDYNKKESVPWNPIIKKVQSVTINNGIENIGDYYFYSLPLDYFILPASVNSVGDHSFNNQTIIYTYGAKLNNLTNKVYYYSESQPTTPGNYFYMDDGVPYIWKEVSPSSILFIGNSYTFRQGEKTNPMVVNFFSKIASNLGEIVNTDYVLESSYTLTKYANSSDELGKVVLEKLTNNQYDYVILQEQSTTPINNFNNFLTAVKSLKSTIDRLQQNCKVILYETWGSTYGLEKTNGKFNTIPEMENALREAYTQVADETGCSVNYVGKAFTYVYENLKDINIIADDNHHQNSLGAYLSAAVHVKSIYKINVNRCTDYCNLDENTCKKLLNVANSIV